MCPVFRTLGFLMLSCWWICGATANAQPIEEKGPDTPPKGESSPGVPTLKVEKGPFVIDVTLKGVFEAAKTSEVVLRPKAWTTLRVVTALEHGAAVKKGEPLVTLDTEQLDAAITELESSLELSAVDIELAEEDAKLMEKSLPLDLEIASQTKDRADQDLLRFLKIDKVMSERTTAVRLKSAENRLEYEQEELRQLEKMYKADDLTEETEEIVLKRQRDAVERAKFDVEAARVYLDRTLQIDLPRQEEELKEAARRQTLNWRKTQATLPMALNQKRLQLKKSKFERSKSEQKLAKLRQDRAAMTVVSPADGIVYYGQCVNGRWPDPSVLAAKLRRGGVLLANEVFMTVIEPRGTFVRAQVPEKVLHQLRPGIKGKVLPIGYPEEKLAATVKELSAIPTGPETYHAKVTAKIDGAVPVMPGMTCTVELTSYSRKNAITVPPAALHVDETRTQKPYVYRLEGGEYKKRHVRVGKRAEKKVEIVEGLKAGDEILLGKPAQKL